MSAIYDLSPGLSTLNYRPEYKLGAMPTGLIILTNCWLIMMGKKGTSTLKGTDLNLSPISVTSQDVPSVSTPWTGEK